jgi:hypothetical protein
LPLTVVAPVLVTVDPAKTAKLAAVPSVGDVARAGLAGRFREGTDQECRACEHPY